MGFVDLNQDVLLRVLVYLDVYTVLQCGLVCSYLRSLAHSKHVWLSLLSDLGRRLLIDLPISEDLIETSVPDLIAQVKRVVLGPFTWAPDAPQPPTSFRKFHLDMRREEFSPSHPTLLLGGRHLVVRQGDMLQMWNVVDGRREFEWAGHDIAHFDVNPSYSNSEMVFAIASAQGKYLAPIKIEVVKFGLDQASVIEMFASELPNIFYHPGGLVLCGKLIGLEVEWIEHDQWGDKTHVAFIVVNWQDAVFFILPGRLLKKSMTLLPGYIVVIAHVGFEQEIVVYSLEAFKSHWQPLNHESFMVAINAPVDVAPALRHTIDYVDAPCSKLETVIAIHECLLHLDSYIVSLYQSGQYHTSYDPEDGFGGRWQQSSFQRYRLTLSTSPLHSHASQEAAPGWRLLSASRTADALFLENLSYAGYGLRFWSSPYASPPVPRRFFLHRAFGPLRENFGRRVHLNEGGMDISLSKYSSAITVCKARGVDVLYYH
ncbi:hypothetical protein GGX14DRAFT_479042 [Mycena pura]|uniref:F-box domain-containing protein n=1 Tax=Mycena pura TaxID=153505 RepID=A0AAD6Y055_9AGAR|nr:hypothetical protein GGX14DRAFT_479042 [Mycena pura]